MQFVAKRSQAPENPNQSYVADALVLIEQMIAFVAAPLSALIAPGRRRHPD
jgi:hypothetical protein